MVTGRGDGLNSDAGRLACEPLIESAVKWRAASAGWFPGLGLLEQPVTSATWNLLSAGW